jgi:GntR family transcriptional regulator
VAARRTFKGLSAEQMADYQGPTYAMFEVEFGVRMVRAEEKIRAIARREQAGCCRCPPARRC